MRHFNYDDNEEFQEEVDEFMRNHHEDDDDDDDDDDEDVDADEIEYLSDELSAAHMSIVAIDLNLKVLKAAIKTCENSWFWRFRTCNKKGQLIAKTYLAFSELIGSE